MFCMRTCYDIYMYTNLCEYIATIWHFHYHHYHLHDDDYDDCAELCDAYDDLLLSLKRVTKSSDYTTQASKRLLLPLRRQRPQQLRLPPTTTTITTTSTATTTAPVRNYMTTMTICCCHSNTLPQLATELAATTRPLDITTTPDDFIYIDDVIHYDAINTTTMTPLQPPRGGIL